MTAESISISFYFPPLAAFECCAAGKLIHAPSGLHLTNLQFKLCKSIQLEVNNSAASCQLQTGLHPAESQGSSSPDKEGLSQRNWPGGHYDSERHLLSLSFAKDEVMWEWNVCKHCNLVNQMIHTRLKLTSNGLMITKIISDFNLINDIATRNVKLHIGVSEPNCTILILNY